VAVGLGVVTVAVGVALAVGPGIVLVSVGVGLAVVVAIGIEAADAMACEGPNELSARAIETTRATETVGYATAART
jgi:hypothetical protein